MTKKYQSFKQDILLEHATVWVCKLKTILSDYFKNIDSMLI